jgi:hypothetical protein
MTERRLERLVLDTPGDDQLPMGWAIVELLGHRRLAGYLSTAVVAGSGFLEIATPSEGDSFVVTLVPPASVYAITPASEETARSAAAAGGFRPEPVSPFEVAPREPRDVDLVAWLQHDKRLERALEKVRQKPGWIPTDDAATAHALVLELPFVDLPY